MATKSASNISIVNEEGVLALAFACIGQDAGIPGLPYMRIFPTSVEQCFNAIHGRNLTSDDPDLSRARSGEAQINLAAIFDGKKVVETDAEKKEDEKKAGMGMIGKIGCIHTNKSIREFVSTLLPIDVVDGIYNKMRDDARFVRESEIEERAFNARIDSKKDNSSADLEEGQIVMFA